MRLAAEIFLASVTLVALKAGQQLNVVQHRSWRAILPISLCMGAAEVVIVVNVARSGALWTAIPLGLGGACGCLLGMALHRRAFGYAGTSESQAAATVGPESEDT